MKILHCSKIIGIAGSENYLLNILPALLKAKIQIEFLSIVPFNEKGSEIIFNKKLEEKGVKVHTLYYNIYFPLTLCLLIYQLIKKRKIEIVHSHLIHADFFIAFTKYLFKGDYKIVSTKHGYEESYNNKFGFDSSFKKKDFYWRIAKWSEKRVHKSFAISNGLKQLYIGLGICKASKLDLIHYGFNFPKIDNSDNSLRFSENQLVIVGRLTEFKGHRYLIDIISILKDRVCDFKLIIVGSGHLEMKLKDLVRSKNLTKFVTFLGYKSNGRDYMANSDIVLIPSRAEGFGVVVLEAMSVKKPIIAFNVPSLNELIENEKTGYLIAPYNIELYAKKIEQLINNPEKRNEISNNAHKKLKEYFCLERMLKETISFYESLLYPPKTQSNNKNS